VEEVPVRSNTIGPRFFAVMGIRRATAAPMPPPMAIATATSKIEAMSWIASVVATAIAIPAIPARLPRRLLSGLASPRSARMKQIPATR